MDEKNQPRFFDGFEYFREASEALSKSDYENALHTLVRGVNDDIALGRDVDGRRLLLCLQAILGLADASLEEAVVGWTAYDGNAPV